MSSCFFCKTCILNACSISIINRILLIYMEKENWLRILVYGILHIEYLELDNEFELCGLKSGIRQLHLYMVCLKTFECIWRFLSDVCLFFYLYWLSVRFDGTIWSEKSAVVSVIWQIRLLPWMWMNSWSWGRWSWKDVEAHDMRPTNGISPAYMCYTIRTEICITLDRHRKFFPGSTIILPARAMEMYTQIISMETILRSSWFHWKTVDVKTWTNWRDIQFICITPMRLATTRPKAMSKSVSDPLNTRWSLCIFKETEDSMSGVFLWVHCPDYCYIRPVSQDCLSILHYHVEWAAVKQIIVFVLPQMQWRSFSGIGRRRIIPIYHII